MRVSDAGLWIIKSNNITQLLGGGISLLVGALMVSVTWRSAGASTEATSGLILGGLLVFCGLWLLIFGGTQTVTIDDRRRCIRIDHSNGFKSSGTSICFDEIRDLAVAEHGDNESGSITYYVQLTLHSGKTLPLFFGFFDGCYSRTFVEDRCRRLTRIILDPER